MSPVWLDLRENCGFASLYRVPSYKDDKIGSSALGANRHKQKNTVTNRPKTFSGPTRLKISHLAIYPLATRSCLTQSSGIFKSAAVMAVFRDQQVLILSLRKVFEESAHSYLTTETCKSSNHASRVSWATIFICRDGPKGPTSDWVRFFKPPALSQLASLRKMTPSFAAFPPQAGTGFVFSASRTPGVDWLRCAKRHHPSHSVPQKTLFLRLLPPVPRKNNRPPIGFVAQNGVIR